MNFVIIMVVVVISTIWLIVGMNLDRKFPKLRDNALLWFMVTGPISWSIAIHLVIKSKFSRKKG